MSRVSRQVWPFIRRINGQGDEAVSTLETDDGRLQMVGPGFRERGDGTVTISGSNVEHDPTTGVIRVRGDVVQ